MNGVLVIDKPSGLTSHDVVNRVRRILQQRSVGHLGTLDPIASGVLPIVAGSHTRLAQFYLAAEKTYEGVIRFGFATDTYDAEGQASTAMQTVNLNLAEVREIASGFRGEMWQTPPPFSAKKIHGVPAYKLARKQKAVELTPVRVEILEFEILLVEGDRAAFRAKVAAGTYVRSIAHEMGQKLGCGAHLSSLRRTASSEFTLADAHTLEQAQAAAQDGRIEDIFVHPRKLLPQLPAVMASKDAAAYIRHGRAVNLSEFSAAPLVKVFYGQKDLIAVAARVAGTLFQPKIVLVAEEASAGSRWPGSPIAK
jgi:tRNA pseudouridine55 synthase